MIENCDRNEGFQWFRQSLAPEFLEKRVERIINCCLSRRILAIEAVVLFELKEIEKKREKFFFWVKSEFKQKKNWYIKLF